MTNIRYANWYCFKTSLVIFTTWVNNDYFVVKEGYKFVWCWHTGRAQMMCWQPLPNFQFTRRLVTCRRRASPEKCVVLSFENLLKYKIFHWILDWIYCKRFDYFRSIISPFLVSFFLQQNSSPCLWRPFKLDLPPKKSFQQALLRRGHNSQNSSIHSTFFVWQFWVW